MQLAIVHSRAGAGIDAPAVAVEAHISGGLPHFAIVGLPETAVKEAKDRVRSAILTSGFTFSSSRITVNLAPADLPKEGGRFDLPIAMGILAATAQVRRERLGDYEFAGELALNGGVRKIRGVLPIALSARAAGRTLIVARENLEEALLVAGLPVVGVETLATACAHVNGTSVLPIDVGRLPTPGSQLPVEDLADVRGQFAARRALEIAAAGAHNLLFIGPPGAGKTMLAQRLPGILPPMTEQEAIESAAVYSVAWGHIDLARWMQRPFRAPHHNASAPAIVGGGNHPRPGEISLAHHGVLFLDELPEFDRRVLEALREPLEAGSIAVARAARRALFPARVRLVAAMNPCPCGYLGSAQHDCRCTPEQVNRYRARISGPLLDRIDLHVEVAALPPQELLRTCKGTEINSVPGLTTDIESVARPESSATVRKRVLAAHRRQLERADKSNAMLTPAEMDRDCALDPADSQLLATAATRFGLSARAIQRIRRVARTIADLDTADRIETAHLTEALRYRILDRAR